MTGPRDIDPLADTVVDGQGLPPATPRPATPSDAPSAGAPADWAAAPMPAGPPPPPGAEPTAPTGPAAAPPAARVPLPPPGPGGPAPGSIAPEPAAPAPGWPSPAGTGETPSSGWVPPAGGDGPGRSSRAPMIALAVIVLGIVGGLVAFSALSRSGGAGDASPTQVAGRDGATPRATADATTPGSSDVPTVEPRPSGTSEAPGQSPSADARYGGEAEQAALLAILPADIRDSCERAELFGAQIAAFACTTADGRSVYYEDYADRASLDDDWATVLEQNSIPVDGGDCTNGTPGERGWYFTDGDPDSTEGRDACYLDDTTPVFLWTDYGTLTRMWLFGEAGSDLKALYERWNQGDLDPTR